MKLASFIILTLLSLIYAGLTAMETASYQTWDQALIEQRQIQLKLAYLQRLNDFTQQVVRRLAIESQRDPALMELLRQRQIKMIIKTPESTKAAPGFEATPATPDKPAPAPPGSTSSHP